jgi:nickel/cobalt transporter (NicO) family protein
MPVMKRLSRIPIIWWAVFWAVAALSAFSALGSADAVAGYFGPGTGSGAGSGPLSGRGSASESGGGMTGPFGGIVMWLSGIQTMLNAELTSYLRTVRSEGMTAAGPVIGAGFLYGVIHAAGPGHGKVIVAGYFLSTPSRLATGVAFSFLMAFVQALVAIALVVVFALIIGTSFGRVSSQVAVVEPIGYALVAMIGAMMLWRALRGRPTCAHCAETGAHSHEPYNSIDDGPGRDAWRIAGVWRRFLAVLPADLRILAVGVGLRPCTGAILLLLFTLAGGIFTIGIVAVIAMGIGVGLTVSAAAILSIGVRAGIVRSAPASVAATGTRLARIVEIAGAGFILVLGTALLVGAVATSGV